MTPVTTQCSRLYQPLLQGANTNLMLDYIWSRDLLYISNPPSGGFILLTQCQHKGKLTNLPPESCIWVLELQVMHIQQWQVRLNVLSKDMLTCGPEDPGIKLLTLMLNDSYSCFLLYLYIVQYSYDSAFLIFLLFFTDFTGSAANRQ